MVSKRIIFYAVASCIVVVLVSMLIPASTRGHSEKGYRWSRTKADIRMIASAIRQFDDEYGKLSDGDSSSVFRAIMGSNPRQIPFLEISKNDNGEVVDFWKTPYQIEIIGTNAVVKCAGQNKKLGDKDDFVFDARNSEFLQDPSPKSH
jgi:hypothetical protein